MSPSYAGLLQNRAKVKTNSKQRNVFAETSLQLSSLLSLSETIVDVIPVHWMAAGEVIKVFRFSSVFFSVIREIKVDSSVGLVWDYSNLLFARNCICLNHSSLSSLSSLREQRLDRGFDPDFINNKKWIEPLCSVQSVFCHTTRNSQAKTEFDALDYQSVPLSFTNALHWRKTWIFPTFEMI